MAKKKASRRPKKTARARVRLSPEELALWYAEERSKYESLADKVAAIIEEVLKEEKLDHHSVTSRAKDQDSYVKKAERYKDPQTEIHDLAGIRVITYVETDARRIADTIRDLFEIDRENSEDKSLELGVDKVGYRSIHYVAELPKARCRLPEFKKFAGLKFEVQVRTILQHSWAEIEHDRNYKFSGVLPEAIQRRFALVAGSLELLDLEFDRIALDIDSYAGDVSDKATAGDLDIPVNTVSLREYLATKFSRAVEAGRLSPVFELRDESGEAVVSEVTRFGISNLDELDKLVPEGLEEHILALGTPADLDGLLTLILLIADAEKYFKDSEPSWVGIHPKAQELLLKYGVDPADLAERHGFDLRY